MKAFQPLVAEAMGTFIFFVIGMGAVVVDKYYLSNIGLVGVALAHGIALSLVVAALGRISGAHVNPAVTAGLWLGQKIDGGLAVKYVVAQLIGAVAAGLLLRGLFPYAVEVTKLGTPMVADGVSLIQAVTLEAVLTFFLVFMVYATAVDPKASTSIAGFGIGLTVFADILVGGPITGAAMNPARAFGPALVSGTWTMHYVYWVGPLIGGLVAGWMYPRWFASDAK